MNLNRIRPLQDEVLVQFLEPDYKVGSIYLADQAKENPKQAIVRRIGTWKQAKKSRALIPFEFKVGDRVLVDPRSGTGIRRNIGERLRMVESRQILAIVEEV